MDDVSEFSFRCRVALGAGPSATAPPAPVPIRVRGTRGATLGTMRADLAELHGLRTAPSVGVFCDGDPLGDDAVLGQPPLLEGCTLTLTEAAPKPPRRTRTTTGDAGCLLQVVSGPDAGRAVPLAAAGVVVGRGFGAGLELADPDVSRRHVMIRPAPGSTGAADQGAGAVLGYLRDLGSTNGTIVEGPDGGTPVAGTEVQLRDGDRVTIGHTRLALRRQDRDPAITVPDGAGHVLVSRSAHLREPLPDAVVRLPADVADPPGPRFPWMQIALPLVAAVPMALLWHQPVILLVALTSPLFFLGQFFVERRGRRRKEALDRDRHAESHGEARRRIAALIASEARDLEDWHPDLATLGLIAGSRAAGSEGGGPRRDLWLRTTAAEGWLSVRLGSGRRRSRVRLEPPDALPQPRLENAPITVDLAASPVLGIAGPATSVRGLARAVVAQLATLCSPDELRIELAAIDEAEPSDATSAWSWVTQLPHYAADGEGRSGDAERVRLVVVDGIEARGAASSGRATPSATGHAANAANAANRSHGARRGAEVFLHLGSAAAELPIDCHAIVQLDDPAVTARLSRAGADPVSGWCPDGLGHEAADALARALAACRDRVRETGALPDRVQLVDLLRGTGTDPLDPSRITDSWRRDDGSCVVPLGSGPSGPWHVDLDRDGPHLLVAGTTGAGKSQLLVSFIAGLAATHPPDAVTFVLVDYKGGAAFGEVRELPHVTGLVTDLDPHLTRRLLTSLGAEIRRRESLLSTHGAADLGEYRRVRPAAAEVLPRLVVVVDEFRVLVEELPDFIPGLVRLAAVGRSLGVHLVLATQRPAGVISADIRANVNLRIALRVRDASDSHDVVECPDAAGLPPRLPGRAVVALPATKPVQVQIATALGAPRPTGRARTVIDRLDSRRPEDSAPVAGSSLPALVTAVRQAWQDGAGVPPRAPWLPALPARLPLGSLRDVAARDAGSGRLALGREDRVEDQSQPPWWWDPSAPGHLACVGSAGSGRTTALRTVALAAGITGHRVHVVDAGGGLEDLAALPHVGNVVPAVDTERCGRLFTALEHEADDPARQERRPRRESLLLVDGWEAVLAGWSEPEFLALADRLLALLRDARPGRIRVVAAGGRSLLTGSAGGSFTERLLLPLSDPADAALAGVPSALAATLTAPGRGLFLTRGGTTSVQVALPGTDDARRLIAQPPRPDGPGSRLWRVPALPDRVALDAAFDLPDQEARAGTEGSGAASPVIGCTPGPAVEPRAGLVRARLPVARNGGSLVLGRPGGGRTTTLDVIEASLSRSGARVARIAGDASAREFAALAELLTQHPETTVLVDDAEALGPAEEEGVLLAHLHGTLAPARAGAAGSSRPLRRAWPRLVAASTAADTANRYRGLLAELKAGRCGVVVGGVQPGDGETFAVRLTAGRATLPGRGLLVDRGRTATVQVAHPAQAPAGTLDRVPRGGSPSASSTSSSTSTSTSSGTQNGTEHRLAWRAGHGEDHVDDEFGAGSRGAGRILREVPFG